MSYTPQEVWKMYEDGESYLNRIKLHETVKKTNRFYNGDQWEGVNAPDFEKPVINIFHRSVDYIVSQVASGDIGMDIRPQLSVEETSDQCEKLKKEIELVIEKTEAKQKIHELARDSCVEGTAFWYSFWDREKGCIELQQIDCDKIIPDNYFEKNIQKQKGVIAIKRLPIKEAKEYAIEKGLSKEEADKIKPDDYNGNYAGEEKDSGKELCTILIRFCKKKNKKGIKTVHFYICTQDVTIVPETDTGYKRIHLAKFPWENRKNCFYGASAIETYIPNQIFVNKMWALSSVFLHKMAFPNRIYNERAFPDGMKNFYGQAFGVSGDPREVLYVDTAAGTISPQVTEMVEKTISYVRESMGVSDAALGNVRPDNTSAIVALQKTTAMPLEKQKRAMYGFWENHIRNIIEIIAVNYGNRAVIEEVEDEEGQIQRAIVNFDFKTINPEELNLHIEVGEGSYWSEMITQQTLSQFVTQGLLKDMSLYIKLIPDKLISGKQQILDSIKEYEMKMQQQMQEQEALAAPEQTPEQPEGVDFGQTGKTAELLEKINNI